MTMNFRTSDEIRGNVETEARGAHGLQHELGFYFVLAHFMIRYHSRSPAYSDEDMITVRARRKDSSFLWYPCAAHGGDAVVEDKSFAKTFILR